MSGITCQECFEADATMQHDDGTYCCIDCYHKKCNEVKSVSKSIVTITSGRKEKQTVQEYIERKLYDNDTYGVAETAANNAEKAQKGLSVLCQMLADRGFITAEDIVNIADDYEQECKLVDDE